FLFQELPEAFHEVGLDPEGIQGLNVLYELRLVGWCGEAAALERPVIALETNAAPEKLDDLRALALADMHETKGADAPAIPALDEALGADEQVDRGAGQIDLTEHGLGKLGLQ